MLPLWAECWTNSLSSYHRYDYILYSDAGSAGRMRRREDQPDSPAWTRLRRQGSPCLLPPSVSYHFIAMSITSLHSKSSLKGSLQWEPRGVRKVAYIWYRSQIVAIEVCLYFTFAVIFDFKYFRFRPSKAKWIGNGLPNRRNAAKRSMFFFFFFITRFAYWRTESSCVIKRCAANRKKNPRSKIWKL